MLALTPNVTYNGRVYTGPLMDRRGPKGGTVVTRDRATALRMWKGNPVRHAETEYLAADRSIMAREYV